MHVLHKILVYKEEGFDVTELEQERIDEQHRAVRFCTSWATREEDVNALCIALEMLSAQG